MVSLVSPCPGPWLQIASLSPRTSWSLETGTRCDNPKRPISVVSGHRLPRGKTARNFPKSILSLVSDLSGRIHTSTVRFEKAAGEAVSEEVNRADPILRKGIRRTATRHQNPLTPNLDQDSIRLPGSVARDFRTEE